RQHKTTHFPYTTLFRSQEEDYHLQLYKRFSLTISHAAGVWVYDDKGEKYLDAVAGIAVNNVGHCHPAVVKAIQEQAGKLIHVSKDRKSTRLNSSHVKIS